MPIQIDYDKCISCKTCYDDCPGDVIHWDTKTDLPIVQYPKECWYCGNCEVHCPSDAINITIPPKFF